MSGILELDFEVPLGGFALAVRWTPAAAALGVFGPSGAGKTTLLETLAGLRRGAVGRIIVDGHTWLDTGRGVRLPPERRGVGYVPQDALLFPHLDVAGNLDAGRRRAAAGGPERHRVIEVLELGNLLARDVGTLSGGERQRVALGRALCSRPELLLLDEPLAGLDAPLRRRILPYLWRVREEFALPALFVSHDAGEVQVLCDEVAVLERGALVAAGHPADVLSDPARGTGFDNVLRGRVASIDGATASVEIGDGPPVHVASAGLESGSRVTLAVRAEDVLLASAAPTGLSARNAFSGTVASIRAGHDGALRVAVGLGPPGPRLVATITTEAAEELGLTAGRPVHALFKVQSCRVLAALPPGVATSLPRPAPPVLNGAIIDEPKERRTEP